MQNTTTQNTATADPSWGDLHPEPPQPPLNLDFLFSKVMFARPGSAESQRGGAPASETAGAGAVAATLQSNINTIFLTPEGTFLGRDI